MIPECHATFDSAYLYLDHLLDMHRVPRVYRYICTYAECPQKLANWYVFKRHILGHVEDSSQYPQFSDRIDQAQEETNVVISNIKFQEPSSTSAVEDIEPQSTAYDNNIGSFLHSAVNYTLKLHSETNLSRSDVKNVQDQTTKLNSNIVTEIEKLLPRLTSDVQTEFELKSYLDKLKSPFDSIDTEHKFLKHLQENNIFRPPKIVTVENNRTVIHTQLDATVKEDHSYLAIMDIEFQLKSFLNCPNILNAILQEITIHQQSNLISTIVTGSRWKEIQKKYPDGILIPVSLYADEFEINDSLSSHNKKHVVCGVYYTIPVIPNQYRSKLCNIFVAAMIKKVDLNEAGFNILFEHVVKAFTDIEQRGLTLHIDGISRKVIPIITLLQGDNLGMHQLLQFLSFNANFYCRFCKRSREQCQRDTHEHIDCIRTIDNYEEDVSIQSPSETGVRGKTVLNELPSFHAVENISVDPMHDFFSNGVCCFGLTAVLNYCIFKKRFVSLRAFNLAKSVFSKSALDSSLRRMPDITDTFVTRKKERSVVIRATASEMKAFMHYFPLIMGPFVPINDNVWDYCKILVQLTEKMLCPTFSLPDIDEINELCKTHHTLYQDLFDEHLKPKHHFVCHYGSVIKTSGNVAHMMNFRNEAKHKGFKEYAHIITSRKNICFTLCMKAALQFSNDLHNKQFFSSPLEGRILQCELETKDYFKSLLLPLPFNIKSKIECTKSIKFKGTEFTAGAFVTKTEIQTVDLYEIVEVLIIDTNELFIVGRQWKVGEFDDHLLAYNVVDVTSRFRILNINYVDGPPIMVYNVQNKQIFRKKTVFVTMDL